MSSIQVSQRCIWGRYRSMFRGDASGKTGHMTKIVPVALLGTGFKGGVVRLLIPSARASGIRARGVQRLPHAVASEPGRRRPDRLFAKLNLTWNREKFCRTLNALSEPRSLWPEALDGGSGETRAVGNVWRNWGERRQVRVGATGPGRGAFGQNVPAEPL